MTRKRNDRTLWAKPYSNLTCYQLAELYAKLMQVVLSSEVVPRPAPWLGECRVRCIYASGWILVTRAESRWTPSLGSYQERWGAGGKQRPSDIRREIEKALNEHRRIPTQGSQD